MWGYLNELVAAPKDRLPIIFKAAALSLDACDFLNELLEIKLVAGQSDWIGLRYWAREVLKVILLAEAVRTWKRVADGIEFEDPNVLLEAMASFTSDPLSYEATEVRTSFLLPPLGC